jgi:hypothetical protein
VASTAAADLVDPRARVCLLAEDKAVSDARANGGLPVAVVVVVVVDTSPLVSPVVSPVVVKFFLFASDLRLFFFSPNTSRMTP